jgi:hypothetical protein
VPVTPISKFNKKCFAGQLWDRLPSTSHTGQSDSRENGRLLTHLTRDDLLLGR